MTYKGKYTVKNPEKYDGNPHDVVYRSHWEKLVMMWCDRTPDVKKWNSESVVIPYFYDVDKKYHRYFMDFKITFTNGKTFLVEVKPKKETDIPKKQGKTKKRYINEAVTYVKNQNKWEAAWEYAKDRGWEFHIWTEETLTEMGIMKSLKPKKKLKPLKPFRK